MTDPQVQLSIVATVYCTGGYLAEFCSRSFAAAREAAQTQAQAQAQAQAQVQSATCAAQEAVEAQNTLAEEAAPVDAAEAAETTIGG